MTGAELLATVSACSDIPARFALASEVYDTDHAALEVATAILIEAGYDPDTEDSDLAWLPFDAADIVLNVVGGVK